MADPNIRPAKWESCPVATQKCMANECRDGCSIACRYEDVFHPDGTPKDKPVSVSQDQEVKLSLWARLFSWSK